MAARDTTTNALLNTAGIEKRLPADGSFLVSDDRLIFVIAHIDRALTQIRFVMSTVNTIASQVIQAVSKQYCPTDLATRPLAHFLVKNHTALSRFFE